MNVVSLSLCYPSDEDPHAGLFVYRRLRALAALARVRMVHAIPTPFWRMRIADWGSTIDDGPRRMGGTGSLPASGHGRTSRPWHPAIADWGLPINDCRLSIDDWELSIVNRQSSRSTWRVPMPYLPLVGKPLNPYLYARAVYPLIASWAVRGEVDIIDAHFSWPDGVAAARVARKLRLPYVVTLRGVLDRYAGHPIKRPSIIRSLNAAAAVIAVSDSLKQSAIHLGLDAHKIHVIPNGVDGDIFKPGDRRAARTELGRAPDETMLVTVGHLCRRKGVHRVLELLPELVRRDGSIRYVVIGADGAEDRFAAHLHRLTRRLGLLDRVTFTGPLEAPDIARWLQAADLFVLPTGNEGWCNALCEAVATGLPVVCTDVGGNGEIVSHSAGALVPFGDRSALLTAIRQMLTTAPDRTSVAQNGPLRTWAHVGAETAAVLRKAMHMAPETITRLTPLCDR